MQYSTDGGTTWATYEVLDTQTTSWQLISDELLSEDYNYVTPRLRFYTASATPHIYYSVRQVKEETIGYLQITAYTSGTAGTAKVKKKTTCLGRANKLWSLGAWGEVPGYPETVMFYQDRLAFANTATNRLRIDLSKTGDYNNFDVSIEVQDDDAITVPLPARSVNAIHSIIPMREMLCFT